MNIPEELLEEIASFQSIHFYLTDPGAVSICRPLIKSLQKRVLINVYTEGWAANNYSGVSRTFTELANVMHESPSTSAIFLGSQTTFSRTHEILQLAKKTKIFSYFIFDHWKNYAEHFKINEGRYIFPDRILLPDQLAKEQFFDSFTKKIIKDHQLHSRVCISGHFYILEMLEKIKSCENLPENRKILSQDLYILIILDPDEPENSPGLGYTVESTLKAMKEYYLSSKNGHTLIIKPHPRQDLDSLHEILAEWKEIPYELLSQDLTIPLHAYIAHAEQVWGVTSIALIIAKFAEKKILSFQKNRNNYGKSCSTVHLEDSLVQ
jgi:hypothetical protein